MKKIFKSKTTKECLFAAATTGIATTVAQYVNHKLEKKEEKFKPDYEEIINSSLLSGLFEGTFSYYWASIVGFSLADSKQKLPLKEKVGKVGKAVFFDTLCVWPASVMMTNYLMQSMKEKRIVNPAKERTPMIDVVKSPTLFKEMAVHSIIGAVMLAKVKGDNQSYFASLSGLGYCVTRDLAKLMKAKKAAKKL